MHLQHIAPLIAAALALSAGCAHAPRRAVAGLSQAARCEEASAVLVRRPRTEPLDELRLALTAPLAYAATGVGWVADGAAVATLAGGGGLLVCAPVLMIEGALSGDGDASAQCFVWVVGAALAVGPPGAGRGLYRATRSWRCPDHVRLAREVQAVASCYSARDLPGDRALARDHLLQLRWQQGIWKCLPHDEQGAVQSAIDALGASPEPP
jgi:hypothetical protein